uniref:Uncharacterized protein n=1 Tax=Lotharella globosa TaxID=91324 RepID=A0A7S3Z6G6_9EUKA
MGAKKREEEKDKKGKEKSEDASSANSCTSTTHVYLRLSPNPFGSTAFTPPLLICLIPTFGLYYVPWQQKPYDDEWLRLRARRESTDAKGQRMQRRGSDLPAPQHSAPSVPSKLMMESKNNESVIVDQMSAVEIGSVIEHALPDGGDVAESSIVV